MRLEMDWSIGPKAYRDSISAAERARAGQKAANNEMSQLPKGSPEFLAKVSEMKELATKVKDLEAALLRRRMNSRKLS